MRCTSPARVFTIISALSFTFAAAFPQNMNVIVARQDGSSTGNQISSPSPSDSAAASSASVAAPPSGSSQAAASSSPAVSSAQPSQSQSAPTTSAQVVNNPTTTQNIAATSDPQQQQPTTTTPANVNTQVPAAQPGTSSVVPPGSNNPNTVQFFSATGVGFPSTAAGAQGTSLSPGNAPPKPSFLEAHGGLTAFFIIFALALLGGGLCFLLRMRRRRRRARERELFENEFRATAGQYGNGSSELSMTEPMAHTPVSAYPDRRSHYGPARGTRASHLGGHQHAPDIRMSGINNRAGFGAFRPPPHPTYPSTPMTSETPYAEPALAEEQSLYLVPMSDGAKPSMEGKPQNVGGIPPHPGVAF